MTRYLTQKPEMEASAESDDKKVTFKEDQDR